MKMKAVKIGLVAALCLALAGCAVWSAIGLACSPETKAAVSGIKGGLVGVIAKAKAYLEELKAERDQATEPGVIDALTKAMDKATNVLHGAEALYLKACNALSMAEWLSAWGNVQVEELQMDIQYQVSMDMARKARLSR